MLYRFACSSFYYVPDPTRPPFGSAQPFNDPAIMSASFSTPATEHIFSSTEYGPPPGLPAPQRLSSSPAVSHGNHSNVTTDGRSNSTQGELFFFYLKGREDSVPSTVLSQCGIFSIVNNSSWKSYATVGPLEPFTLDHQDSKSVLLSPSPDRW